MLTASALCAIFAPPLPAATAAATATAPPGFFGVGGWSYPTDAQSASLGAGGVGLVRGALTWGIVQPSPSPASRNWSDADRLARDAARNGYNLIIDLSGCAVWACGAVNAPPTGAALPGYESFVRAAVARYDPTSSFWAGLPRVPTVSWQVWNEVNGGYFWPNPTPAAYATFLGQIGSTIKSVDPTATVVMSGLVDQPAVSSGMPLTPFLAGLYQQPGFPGDTAAIAVHAYAADPAASLHVLDEARRVTLTVRRRRPPDVGDRDELGGRRPDASEHGFARHAERLADRDLGSDARLPAALEPRACALVLATGHQQRGLR